MTDWVKGDIIGRMHAAGGYYDLMYTFYGYHYWSDPYGDWTTTEHVEELLKRDFAVLRKDGSSVWPE